MRIRIALVAGILGILWVFVASQSPADGESVGLRWLRKVVEHPLRSALGIGLGLWALTPDRPFRSRDSGQEPQEGA